MPAYGGSEVRGPDLSEGEVLCGQGAGELGGQAEPEASGLAVDDDRLHTGPRQVTGGLVGSAQRVRAGGHLVDQPVIVIYEVRP